MQLLCRRYTSVHRAKLLAEARIDSSRKLEAYLGDIGAGINANMNIFNQAQTEQFIFKQKILLIVGEIDIF